MPILRSFKRSSLAVRRIFNNASANRPARASTAHRGIWTVCDQIANSLFNLGLGVASARLLTIESFGFFSVLFAAYLIFRGVFRALVLEPIAVNYPKQQSQQHESTALGIALLFAVFAGVILFASQALLNTYIEPSVIGLCTICICALLYSDIRRMFDMISGNTFNAAKLSVSMCVTFIFSIAIFHQSIQSIASLFCVAIISVFLSLLLAGGFKLPVVNPVKLCQWVTKHWNFSGPLVFEFLASAGLAAVAIILIGLVGLQESAAYRGAQMVAAPVHMFFLAIATFIVVEASRSGAIVKVARLAGLLMAAVGVGYLLFLLATNFIPEVMLGNAAVSAIPVIIPLAVHALLSSVSVICSSILKVQGETKRLIKLRMMSFIPESLAIAVGYYMGSASHMAICSAIALFIVLPLWIKPLREAGVIGRAKVVLQ